MYEIALTVASCLRSGTRADVAWVVDAEGISIEDWSQAVVFTPGGGRTGTLVNGALDGQLMDRVGRGAAGRLVGIEVGEVDALIAGLDSPGTARCLVVPADSFPSRTWDLAIAREPMVIVCSLDGDEVTEIALFTEETAGEAGGDIEAAIAGPPGSTIVDGRVVSVFKAVIQLVVVGSNPVSDALVELAGVVGWQARAVTNAASATGVIATLSPKDKVVVTGHDLELAGAALMAALESAAGYIGSLGARRMQENRADWLAYRGVTDLTRIHGPAGLDIGAESPAEIAVAILAEAISEGSTDDHESGGERSSAMEQNPGGG